MGLGSTLLNVVGVIFLSHAVYSAYEHSLLTSTSGPSTSSTITGEITPLPLDIKIETFVSLLILCTGIVLGAPALRPIQWSVWASDVEKEDHLPPAQRRALIEKKLAGTEGGGAVGNPFVALEERPGFLDIRKRRREFADWVRQGGGGKPAATA